MGFTNSKLISATRISPNRTIGRQQPITKITPHHMAGKMSIEQFGDLVANPAREMSSNYAIGYDGRIILTCPEADRSWCSSSPWNDHRSVTIEVSNVGYGEPWTIPNAAYTSLIKLCVDICQRNGIRKLEFTGGKEGSLTYHYMFNPTSCPGTWMKQHTGDLVSKVNAELAKNPSLIQLQNYTQSIGDSPENGIITSSDYALTGTLMDVEPNYKDIKSYMVTLNGSALSVDYEALRGIGVIGVMLNAGHLYDGSHMEVNHFVNPSLAEQVAAAKQANMPYAFYTTVRARNVQEANLELKWLRIYIQKYTPPLGVWLKLELSAAKSMNDMIIDRYKTLLTASGLKGKMGFYVTRSQLQAISWDKWQDDYLLWLIDPVKDISEIEQILTPKFFDL